MKASYPACETVQAALEGHRATDVLRDLLEVIHDSRREHGLCERGSCTRCDAEHFLDKYSVFYRLTYLEPA